MILLYMSAKKWLISLCSVQPGHTGFPSETVPLRPDGLNGAESVN